MILPPGARPLISFARPEAYGPLTQVILAKLGYGLVQAEAWNELPEEVAGAGPALAIADERRLAEVWTPGRETLRTVVLTGRHGVTGDDPRIVAAVHRPAGLHELYRVLQETLEAFPRSAPRIPTYLLEVSFDLPRVGRIETSAESAYQLVPNLRLIFSGTPAASRNAILDFVEQTLAIT